ncbi:MAG: 4'-phosphopantetheinyl transferase superfamily protein [Verrucomicrobia bacterium]|nr:4'-phosphopantetheinyl transferase superfamily protein [Prolixibacteraceae bacterium]
MPIYKSISIDKGLLSVWQISETLEELLSAFTQEELADPAFQSFTFEKRKCEWLATRALLKQMIGAEFKVSYSPSGKPLLNHLVYKHISISHSRDFVVVYLHQDQAVGIDVESMNRNYAPITKRYLSESELGDVKENILHQCLYWCAKEAIFKLVEDEGIDFRKQIEVMALDSQKTYMTAKYTSADEETIYRLQYDIFHQHCMVWACNIPSTTIKF